MPQTRTRFNSFEEYLSYSDEMELEGRYELVNGELVELPPESELNDWIATNLRDQLGQFIWRRLIKTHTCEVQVPVLQPKDAANRYPDLVVLRPEHLELTQRRLTIPARRTRTETICTSDRNTPRSPFPNIGWLTRKRDRCGC